LLVEKGADVNVADHTGRPAFIRVVESGHIGLVTTMLDKGANPNGPGPGTVPGRPLRASDSPLLVAVQHNRLEIAKLLLRRGADVNVQGSYGGVPGCSALMMARCKPEFVEALLEAGADPAIKDSQGRTARDYLRPDDFIRQAECHEAFKILKYWPKRRDSGKR
jgi:ankyrin repeat protein